MTHVNPIALGLGRAGQLWRRSRNALRARLLHGRAFSGAYPNRLLILSLPERIPQSQIHPFHYYAGQIAEWHGTELREADVHAYAGGGFAHLHGATTVAFQTGFDITRAELERLTATIRRRNPKARLVYLDWFAPTDLRLAARINDLVDLYVKKHLLADADRYGQPTLGDTNLTDHYARRFGLDLPETRFEIPQGFLDKLVLGPSFVTADFMIGTFAGAAPLGRGPRPIDLHARIAVEGSPWYQAMRGECRAAVQGLQGLETVTETGVGLVRYLLELRASKICFSPFGYGEVCWRDFEAAAHGAVLLKPVMSHIRTRPDIFQARETYMPLAWDLSDFEDRLGELLDSAGLRKRLSENAFSVLHDYVVQARFVEQMAPVLA